MSKQRQIKKRVDKQSIMNAQNAKNTFHPDEFKLTTSSQLSEIRGLQHGMIIYDDYFANAKIYKSFVQYVTN
jgi:hypothetical protein